MPLKIKARRNSTNSPDSLTFHFSLPSMSCAHALNSDISGIGVRVSYYLQTLFLGCLAVRSGSIDEIAGALYTLMATNTAMAITGLILGLKPKAEISFQDAIIIVYLLSMAWITVIAVLAACNRLSDATKTLQMVSVCHSYIIISFTFVVLGKAPSFGQDPDCNQEAVAAIFRPFSALRHGRIFGWCSVSLMCLIYTVMTARDYTAKIRRKIEKMQQSHKKASSPSSVLREPVRSPYFMRSTITSVHPNRTLKKAATYYETSGPLVDYQLLVVLLLILALWVFFVLNTELIIHWYQPIPDDSASHWQFGQILPMFLIFLPLINMISAFKKFGLKPTKRVYERVEVSTVGTVFNQAECIQVLSLNVWIQSA
ncbi:hypothetical protein DFH08DRAFT_1090220 [Mycena albidolilacea]|uniref:Uncharacterized protein n=1 Tax=Mycena albidolilacea TaxID=1033008 RepID=A0AAD6YYG3_9AGAR|nr:hypothetical protein DFH08DRAFT_1090220 [Mycena albidolilacea]